MTRTTTITRRLLTVIGATITAVIVPAAAALATTPIPIGGVAAPRNPISIGGLRGPNIPPQGGHFSTHPAASGLAVWAVVLMAVAAVVVCIAVTVAFRSLRRRGATGKLAAA